MTRRYKLIGLGGLAAAAMIAGCGGSSGNGPVVNGDAVAVSGTVAAEGTGAAATTPGSFRILATASSGATHETEADHGGQFTLTLPPGDSYVMGFEHPSMMSGGMHFDGNMAFGCGAGESDHFFVSGREHTIELGTIRVHPDGSFARPERNPLDQTDRDGDGTPDSRDPDTHCVGTGDNNHDGFYDDDMNHDGHHDDHMHG